MTRFYQPIHDTQAELFNQANRSWATLPGRAARLLLLSLLAAPPAILAQAGPSAETPPPAPGVIEQSRQNIVPTLVRFRGSIAALADRQMELRFAIYAGPGSDRPLWFESQQVRLGATGEYEVLLGAGSEQGLPQSLFVAGEPRWLAVSSGEHEEPRVLLTSVPYALKAADASTLEGRAAADFVTREDLRSAVAATGRSGSQVAAEPVSGTGTAGTLPVWTGTSTLGNSMISEAGVNVGIGTAAPAATLDVNGVAVVRGELKLKGNAAPTAAAGVDSPQLYLAASSYSSASKVPVRQSFAWQALSAGNNTASPTGNLALLFGLGSADPKATGLSIAPSGVITFAPGQAFPSSATLFPKGATFDAESYVSGSSSDWMLVATNTSASSKGTILGQASASGTGVEGASPGGIGVKGVSDTGFGLYGISNTTGTAIYGAAYGTGAAGSFWSQNATGPAVVINNVAGGTGIASTATNGYGGLFSNTSTFQSTVYATNTGTGNAGTFNNNSASRVALAGVNASNDSNAIATYGSAANGKAVYGVSSTGNGVYGLSSSGTAGSFNNSSDTNAALTGGTSSIASSAIGVNGVAPGGTGVLGTTTTGIGVEGHSISGIGITGISGGGGGVSGVSSSGVALYGTTTSGIALEALTQSNYAGYFQNDSSAPTIYALNAKSGGVGTLFKVFLGQGSGGACGISSEGSLSCTGGIKTLVTTASARQVETYSVQSSESWLEDFGSGKLAGGRALVRLDAAFADAANTGVEYHVFLTPKGDAQPLFVTHETASGFEVVESSRGKDSIEFDYRIVAKRLGSENERLLDVTDKLERELAAGPERLRREKPVSSPAPVPIALSPIAQAKTAANSRKDETR
jgi:hypothetical protein